ncbi:YaaC family protein [Halalkalibacter alkalisediminis]|uniref:YaaC family protein n=1 Tax=Halalkalibacter alkalisediminis TaxID=935616 RepID=A0ABV6NHN1_9BACI|nr:YaaC family protein [Halalkalibacter alkalisediminis]
MIDGHYDLFIPFYSATYSSRFLTERYEIKQITKAKSKSYQVCSSFMYHLQHGQLYFKQASTSPIELKPILLFYGYVQLIKACILSTDPNYPENTQVLAHGVTTRKRKKATYRFLEDEVKIQKNGLFSSFLDKMFHVKHQEGEKYQMLTLFQHLGDMHHLFQTLHRESISLKGKIKDHQKQIIFSSKILDLYHMTPNRFEQFLESLNHTYKGVSVVEDKNELIITLPNKPNKLDSFPFSFDRNNHVYLLKERQNIRMYSLPEMATHFLLLYNLSMICRYEAEWWGDLIHTFDGTDFPFISHYLNIAQLKIPHLVHAYLQQE